MSDQWPWVKGLRGLGLLVGLCGISLSSVAEVEKYDPEYEYYLAPVYPSYLGQRNISGCVKLSYIVQREGAVSDIRVLKTTHQRFANAATFAVARWLFKPWEVSEEKPASVQWIVNLHFRADEIPDCDPEAKDEPAEAE